MAGRRLTPFTGEVVAAPSSLGMVCPLCHIGIVAFPLLGRMADAAFFCEKTRDNLASLAKMLYICIQ